jgi:hypothetical protein
VPKGKSRFIWGKVAGPTRLELATSGVTGRRSNQLNYDPAMGWPIIGNRGRTFKTSYIFSRAAMRSSMGGWVLKSRLTPPLMFLRGLTI